MNRPAVSVRDTLDASHWPHCRTVWSCQAERGPLFRRYYLLETRWFGVYLHHLLATDDERAMHDHPWSFVTFLLSSGYFEHTPVGLFWHQRFSILYRPAEWTHRLTLLKPTWTLIFKFRRRREWGFYTKQGWMQFEEYGKMWCD